MTAYTNPLGLIEPTPNDPAVANIWGTLLNTNQTLLAEAIAGILPLDVSGNSNVVLTVANGAPDQARYAMFIFTGVLTGNIDVLWPDASTALFAVKNSTSGAFTLSLGANNGSGSPAGTTVVIPQGYVGIFYSDGTNVGSLVDIQSILDSPLPLALGGTNNTTGQPSGTAGGDLAGSYPNPTLAGSLRNLRSQVFTGDGTFTIPAAATTATVFKFTAVGGGGGGGSSSAGGGGGGAGGYGWAEFSGFTAADSVSISLGGSGAGVTGNSVGGTGGSTTVTYDATAIVTASGGAGGKQTGGGVPGTFTSAVGGSGLTLVGTQAYGGQPGGNTIGASNSGFGGGSPISQGGAGVTSAVNGNNGTQGGGGSGQGSSVGGNTSGAGGGGAVIVEWVL